MPHSWSTFVVLALVHLLGAVPFALVLGRTANVDLRAAGSGDVGAGNLTRPAGLRLRVPAAVLDEGQAPTLVAGRLGPSDGVAAGGGHGAPRDFGSRLPLGLSDTDRALEESPVEERAMS